MEDAVSTARKLFQEGLAHLSAADDAAAEASFRQAEALIPGDPAVLHKLGDLALRRRDYALAEDFYRQAHEKVPQSHGYRMLLGHMRLFRGDWAGGFPLFDSWRERPENKDRAAADSPIPRWAGEPLEGKRVLIWSEEGFGDQIMYARFALELQRRGASIVWVAPPELVRLFRDSLGVVTVPAGVGATVPGVVNYMIPSSALPALLMPELKTVSAAPYLKAPEPNTPKGARIGVMARGNPGHRNDYRRSLDDASAARLLALPGAIDLSPAATGARDFYETAAIIAGLDLVIAVDTAVAHLAGAMGKPVAILLATYGLDWRWGRAGQTTPWYGHAQLFRQKVAGEWAGAVDDVIAQAGV